MRRLLLLMASHATSQPYSCQTSNQQGNSRRFRHSSTRFRSKSHALTTHMPRRQKSCARTPDSAKASRVSSRSPRRRFSGLMRHTQTFANSTRSTPQRMDGQSQSVSQQFSHQERWLFCPAIHLAYTLDLRSTTSVVSVSALQTH